MRVAADDALEATVSRETIVAFLREMDGIGDLWAVEAIVGELVANVVQHAPGPIAIAVDWDGVCPRLIVSDRGRPFAREANPSDLLAESGRGLQLVAMLGYELMVERTADDLGNCVSVLLPYVRLQTI